MAEEVSAVCIQPMFCTAEEQQRREHERLANAHYVEQKTYYMKIMDAQNARGITDVLPMEQIKLQILIMAKPDELSIQSTNGIFTYIKKYSLHIHKSRLTQATQQLEKHQADNIIDILTLRIRQFNDALKTQSTLMIIEQSIRLLSTLYLTIVYYEPNIILKNNMVITVDMDNQVLNQWDVFSTKPFISLIHAAFAKFKENPTCLYLLLTMIQLMNQFNQINFINTYGCLNDLHESIMNDTPDLFPKNNLKLVNFNF